VGTDVVLQVVRQFVCLRVNEQQERQGLDVNAHGEEAYKNEFTG
jgi:Amt family ammonium transporter